MSRLSSKSSKKKIFNVFVKVQKVNGWKASLGGVHLQKIENQVGEVIKT